MRPFLRGLPIGAVLLLLALGSSLSAQAEAGGPSFALTGKVSTFARLSYFEAPFEGSLGPAEAVGASQAITELSADGQGLLFRLRLAATAQADRSSTLDAGDFSNALALDVREAETALQTSSAFVMRTGLLLRSFGVGTYGSPINPFARDEDQGGFWGFDAEWTPGSTLSALGIVSADRAARSGRVAGMEDFDAGTLLRFSPGILDAAAGLYASGRGQGELRPLGYVSLPLFGFLVSFEGAISVPVEDPAGQKSESLRVELRRSLDLGGLSLELGAAYRGIFPGRDAAELGALAAALPVSGPPAEPFAPFYGRHYAELSIYGEKSDAFALTAEALFQLPWGSLSADTRFDLYLGQATLFFRVQLIAGEGNGEFLALARAEGQPLLVLWTGLEFPF